MADEGGGADRGGAGGPYRSIQDPCDEGPDEPRTRIFRVVSRLAALYEALGRPVEAAALRERAEALRERVTAARRSERR